MQTVSDEELEVVDVKGFRFLARRGTWDHSILYHTADYALPKSLSIPDSACIVDIGGHIGGFSVPVASFYNRVKLHCFEPDRANFALLQENTNHLGNICIHNAGIGVEDGFGTSHIASPGNTGMNRLLIGEGDIRVVSPGTLFQLVEGKDIAFMKMDCEGGEWAFLANLSEQQRDCIWEIQGELHTDLFHLHPPFAAYPAHDQAFLRPLLQRLLPEFKIFMDSTRLFRACHQCRFL